MNSEVKKMEYDIRFRTFLRQIIGVSRMKPKERYLYPLMDGVPFKDLETAILMKNIDYGIAENDNNG
ncbi:MAG: hypothetical protein WC989_05185 [Micavibrio sp.]